MSQLSPTRSNSLRSASDGAALAEPDHSGANNDASNGSARDASAGAVDDMVAELASDPRCVHVHRQDPRVARHSDLIPAPPSPIGEAIPQTGLWSHQVEAIERIREGESVAISTGTASGKSMCFQIPIAESVLGGRSALGIFPTKALAQDQLISLTSWQVPGLVAAAFDGDCSPEERSWVRSNANVVFTNPEMLHNAILPGRQQWTRFLRSVEIVVVDELHVLRGVFGTNVAHVLRRLRRTIRQLGGNEPTFVFTSATIGQPAALAGELCGLRVEAVSADGSPKAQRDVIIWNPAEAGDHAPLSVNTESAMLAARLIRAGLRTLVFAGSRRSTEVVAQQIRRMVGDSKAVRSYRGGYLRDERRAIESELFNGELTGIVATSALELGVDIGGLDAVVMGGYPGTVASFHQQIGRSGRSAKPSLAVLVAGENQLDQWICSNPRELFTRPPEHATISLDNPYIFVPHLGCAAHERPLSPEDSTYWPTQLDEGVRQLVMSDRARLVNSSGDCRDAPPRVAWSGRGSPARTIGIRSTDGAEFRIVNRAGLAKGPDRDRSGGSQGAGTLIGTVPEGTLYTAAHVGAIYLHQGATWRVVEVSEQTHTVTVEPDPGDTYTLARSSKDIGIISCDRTRTFDGWSMSIGEVEVVSRVTGYQVRSRDTHEVMRRVPLEVPDTTLNTRAIWYTFEADFVDHAGVVPDAVPGSLHAVEHGAIGMLPLFAICDRWDVGGLSTEWLADTNSPTIVIHDSYPGGAGMAEMAFESASRHLPATLDVVQTCRCDDGCPRCVQSPKCGNGNEPLDKTGAIAMLDAMCRTGFTE